MFLGVSSWVLYTLGLHPSVLPLLQKTTQETLKAPMANQASSMISRKPQLFNTTSSSQHLDLAGRTGVPKDEERLGYVFVGDYHSRITIKIIIW